MPEHIVESQESEGKVPVVSNHSYIFLFIFIVFAFLGIIGFWCYRHDKSVKHYEACQANLKIIGTALEMYSTDHSGHYPQVLSDISPQYVASIPTCPGADYDTYSNAYHSAWSPDSYTVYCAGRHHEFFSPVVINGYKLFKTQEIPENFPQYNSISGLIPR